MEPAPECTIDKALKQSAHKATEVEKILESTLGPFVIDQKRAVQPSYRQMVYFNGRLFYSFGVHIYLLDFSFDSWGPGT